MERAICGIRHAVLVAKLCRHAFGRIADRQCQRGKARGHHRPGRNKIGKRRGDGYLEEGGKVAVTGDPLADTVKPGGRPVAAEGRQLESPHLRPEAGRRKAA